MEALKLQRNIDYGSVLPIIVFISGLLVIYFFSSSLFSEGIITMLFSSILYIVMVVIRSTDVRPPTQFNLILENISTFMTFGISTILFGIIFYSPNVDILFILFIYFFAIACVLSMARNWEYDIRDSLGMPLAFNGIFFPLFYYMYRFFFNELGSSIFLIYYLVAGILTLSGYKFLWFDEKYIKDKKKYDEFYTKIKTEDELVDERIKQRETKHFQERKLKDKQRKQQIKKDVLEDSILDKIQNKISNLFTKQDNWSNIKGMPTLKELDETLPHTAKIVKQKKKRKLYQRIIRYLFYKYQKPEENWNTIKGMPSEEELEETLKSTKAKNKVIDNLSKNQNPKRKEKILTKIIKFIQNIGKEKQYTLGHDKVEDIPTKEEVARTLPHTEKKINKHKQHIQNNIKPKKKEKFLTKIIKFFQNIGKEKQYVLGHDKVENVPTRKEIEETLPHTKEFKKELDTKQKESETTSKPKQENKQERKQIVKENTTKINKDDFDLVGGNNNINTIKKPKQENKEQVQTSNKIKENKQIINKQKEIEPVNESEFIEDDYDFDQEIDFEDTPTIETITPTQAVTEEQTTNNNDYDYEQEIDFEETPQTPTQTQVNTQQQTTDDEFDFDQEFEERK